MPSEPWFKPRKDEDADEAMLERFRQPQSGNGNNGNNSGGGCNLFMVGLWMLSHLKR